MRIPGTALELPGTGRGFSERPALTLVRGDDDRSYAPRGASSAAIPAGGASGSDTQHPFSDLIMGGIDVTPDLTGRSKFLIYEEMRKSDPAIKSSLWMYKLPIRQADWALDPFDQQPINLLIHDAVAWQFGLNAQEGELDLTWDEWLQQSMLFFDFGAMFEEVEWGDPTLWRPSGDDGTSSRIIRPINRFAPRFPSTINEIETDKATGKIKRMRQILPGADWMPGEQLCTYVLEKEGTNWFGTSLLRAMYGPWRLKKALMIASAIGWDRFSAGVPVVRYPQGGGAKMKADAEQAARNYRLHERGYLVFEGPKGKDSSWDIEIIDGSKTIADPTPLLGYYDEQISTAALQQFSVLGKTATGARAVGEILIDPFYQAVGAHARFISSCRQRQAIRRFVDVNFGTTFDAPLLRVGKIQSKNVIVLAQAIEFLSAAGLSFTDRQTQNDIRDMLDLAQLPEDVQQVIDDADPGIEVTGPAREGSPIAVPPEVTAA